MVIGTEGRTEGQTEGRTEGQTEGRTDGRTDGRTNIPCILQPLPKKTFFIPYSLALRTQPLCGTDADQNPRMESTAGQLRNLGYPDSIAPDAIAKAKVRVHTFKQKQKHKHSLAF